ncbi:MAG TPA: ion channel [Candidatus Xenobia bacterium]|jgi:potassium channel LctB
MQAVRLLKELGYQQVVHLEGGMEAWRQAGFEVEAGPRPERAKPVAPKVRSASDLLESLGSRTVAELARIWLIMVVATAVVYWLLGAMTGNGLVQDGQPVGVTWRGLGEALYFSGVTATSVGYGDVLPQGLSRVVSLAEAVAELLIFGGIVSKMVSRRQDRLIEDINRNSFEERLGRVRTNLHFILTELQSVSTGLAEERMRVRLESIAAVFVGEVRTIHDLLYGSLQEPEELVLGTILDSLAAAMQEMAGLTESLCPCPASLHVRLESISALCSEICGECVPRQYEKVLHEKLDTVQALGVRLAQR